MVLSVFKSGDELFNQGVDLVKRKEFAKARRNFDKTIEKGGKEAGLARVYIYIIDLLGNNKNPSRYMDLAESLDRLDNSFEFGLTEVDPPRIALECRLLAQYYDLVNMQGNTAAILQDKGNRFLELARIFQSKIGNESIKLYELAGWNASTGIRESLIMQVRGYDSLASATVMTDPKKAAELLQNAFTCRKQLGEDGQSTMNLITAYSKSVKCWICGRPSTGEGINFLAMSSEISPFMRNSDTDILKSAPPDYNSIYVCKPCYSSVSRRADEIAKVYHDRAMAEMRAMEARLQAEIRSVAAYSTIRR